MANISVSDSTYVSGGIDTRASLNGTSLATFQQMNGAASGVIAIEVILGDGPTLRGTQLDLASRLAVALTATGEVKIGSSGVFQGLTTNYGLLATSSSTLVPRNIMPVGLGPLPWPTTTAPPHWVLCTGQALSRTTYAALFSVIGTTFGVGDGSTTFNVPDLRGRVPMGQDNMGGSDAARVTSASTGGGNADVLGGTGGAQTHTLTVSEIPSHDHDGVSSFTTVDGTGGGNAGLLSTTIGNTSSSANSTVNMPSSGGGGQHSNTQPWLAVSYIMYAGV